MIAQKHLPEEPDSSTQHAKKRRRTSFAGSLHHSFAELVSGSKSKWGRLQDIERKRRALLKRTDEGTFKIIFSIQGTFWRILVRTTLLWVTVAIFVLVRLESLWGPRWAVPPMDASHVGVVGGIVTFLLVYFHIQYSNRFDRLYSNSSACQGRIFDLSLLARSTLPKDRATRLMRYMNAAHILGYVGLSPEVYSMDDCFYHLNKKYKLLTQKEFDRLREVGTGKGRGSAMYREALSWCVMDIHDALRCGVIGEYSSILFLNNIMTFRSKFGNMYDLDDQPIMFFYIHFIHFLSAVYLPLLAVFVAHQVSPYNHWMSDAVGLIAVVLQGIFVIGIRVLAQIMQHPYGDELENLSVLTYIDLAYFGSMRVLNS